MSKKEFTFKGKTPEELKKLSINELAQIFTARQRRVLKRGFTEQQKTLLKKLRANEKNVETHCRDMVILPEMIGHCLGEFALTRKKVAHSAPGIGATKSSASLSVK